MKPETAIVREAEDLNIIAVRISRRANEGLSAFRDVGDDLLRAKKLVGHGQFKDWLKKNVPFSYSSCQRYMRLAEHWESVSKDATMNEALDMLSEDQKNHGGVFDIEPESPKESHLKSEQDEDQEVVEQVNVVQDNDLEQELPHSNGTSSHISNVAEAYPTAIPHSVPQATPQATPVDSRPVCPTCKGSVA